MLTRNSENEPENRARLTSAIDLKPREVELPPDRDRPGVGLSRGNRRSSQCRVTRRAHALENARRAAGCRRGAGQPRHKRGVGQRQKSGAGGRTFQVRRLASCVSGRRSQVGDRGLQGRQRRRVFQGPDPRGQAGSAPSPAEKALAGTVNGAGDWWRWTPSPIDRVQRLHEGRFPPKIAKDRIDCRPYGCSFFARIVQSLSRGAGVIRPWVAD